LARHKVANRRYEVGRWPELCGDAPKRQHISQKPNLNLFRRSTTPDWRPTIDHFSIRERHNVGYKGRGHPHHAVFVWGRLATPLGHPPE